MPASTSPKQLADDPELLDLMLSRQSSAASVYQVTNYWKKYIGETIRVLRQDGLRDFRRQPMGYFRSFGACDATVTTALQKLFVERSTLPPNERATIMDYLEFAHRNPDLPILPFYLKLSDLDQLAARFTDMTAFLSGAEPLARAEPEFVGNPWASFEYKGRRYTQLYLTYYLRYCAAARFVDFSKVDSVVELGSGAGNQVEIIKKLYPHLTFYLLDLAPYLYVCHQFLKSVFPTDVIDYREMLDSSPATAPRPGSIVFLDNSRLGEVRPRGSALFWNSASFGEMEPDVVRNYLHQGRRAWDGVFLYQSMGGKELGSPGSGGVLQQTRFGHYEEFLGADFHLVDRSPAYHPLRWEWSSGGYEDALWVRSKPPWLRSFREIPSVLR